MKDGARCVLQSDRRDASTLPYHSSFYSSKKRPVRNLMRKGASFALRAATLALALSGFADASAQDARLQLAVGASPGVGVVIVHSTPTLFVFTREASFYADYSFAGTDGLLVAAGVGAGIQIDRILNLLQNSDEGLFGLDVGVRLGPSFFYAITAQTAEEDARSFRVMFDPFARGTYRASGRQAVFAEFGAQAPNVRAGLSLGL